MKYKKSVNIAIVQESPVYYNLEKSLKKMLGCIEKASAGGANMVVFGETWLTGYPAWLDYCPEIGLWDHQPTKEAFLAMYLNSFSPQSKEGQVISQAAFKHKVYICFGANEVPPKGAGHSTIFNSFFIYAPSGELVLHHRKLMPTFTEKLLYGLGDANGLKSIETPFGYIGGLICWEHWMPLSRQVLHNSNEHIHFALWPCVVDRHQLASRHYAFEGRCTVIAVGQIMRVSDIPGGLTLPDGFKEQQDKMILNGGSCVYGPGGETILEPQYDQEGIFHIIISPVEAALRERMTLDVSGHYNRWDIFTLKVDKKQR